MILVTGATGRIGRLVVDELRREGGRKAAPIRALTRQPQRATLPAGVEVVTGDFTAPASLASALEGVTTLFLVWTAPLASARDVIERLASRPRRVVYLSAPFRTPHPFFQQPNPMRAMHEEIERLLASSGLDVAILRPGMFMSNALHWWAPQLRSGDTVRWPYAAAETAPVDERDIAQVAARVLRDPQFARSDYVLTGPQSLRQAEQVREIGDSIGRRLTFEELAPDAFRREASATWPSEIADMLLHAWQATLGHPAHVTQAVQEVLGRPARTMRQWAADHAAAFAKE